MAAQDAELKLKVSLDLAFFRQQLAGLGQAAAGTPLPVQIRFDRRSVQDELNALGANIKRRNYRLNIETNLSAEIAKADTLARKLTELNRKVKAAAGGAFSQGPQGAAGLERFMREQGLTGRAFGVQQAQENIARQAILSRLEKKSSIAGGYNVPGLKKIISDLGGTPTGSRTDLVAQAKKLVEEADGISDAVFNNLKDLQMKLRPIRGQAQTSAARSMPNLNEMLDRMANLTSNPRAAQRMLRALPESRITTNLVGAANRQAAFQQQFPQGFTLPGFNAPKAFDPLLKAIAKDFSDYAKTVNISDPWVGQVSNGIANVIAKAVASPQVTRLLPAAGQTSASRMTQQMFAGLPALQAPGIGMENAPLSRAAQYMLNKARRDLELPIGPASPYAPNPFAGQATVPSRQYFQPTMRPALPAAGGTSGLLSALEAQLGASRGMLGTGGGIATSLFTGRGLVNPGVSMLEPVGLSGNYRQMAAALANQAANPALAHRQIADIGFGAVPTSATGLSGQALNAALNQAFLQRRGLGISGAQSMPIFGAGGVAVQQNIPGMAYQMGGGGLGGSMGQFPMAGMMGPSTPMSINARTSMFGGGGGMQPPGGGGGFGGFSGMGGFGRALGDINLPGSGVIRELGEEFGFATKQVILFGQAYKLLAFIQNLPAQVGAAVGQLQSFRNTLNAVTPSAEEARASNELLLGLMEKYNVPLQSARDGFTKLYASMAPAGFSGDEIRDLFTGITKAAATFGMSADKVDRVNYAFAQMASKGQVMSEELKGQLGDVLPGAMALFAEAAGFKGPKAIQDFSAALEDGAYKGEAMVALLKNVTVVMNKEFGPGAEGAALTFQGVMNRMQNSMTLFYEAFEPVAVGFLNTVVVPMTNGIKQLTDGLNAFFTGTAAKTAGGFGIAQELEKLRPAFAGIAQNIQQLIPVFQQFANTALGLGRILLEIAGNPFVGYLARVYISVLPLTIALQALNLKALIPLIASFVRAIPVFIAYTAATAQGVTANKALQLAMQISGTTATTTAGQIRSVSVAIKVAFTGTVILAAVAGIGILIEKIISLNAQMADTKAKALGAAQAIRAMSQTEAQQATRQYESGAQSLKVLNQEIEEGKLKGKAWIEVTGQQAKALQDAGVIVSNVRGSLQVQPTRIPGAFQKLEGLAAEGRYRVRQITEQEKMQQMPATLGAIPPSGGEGKTKEKELDQYNRSQLDFIQQRFDKEKQIIDQQKQLNLLSQTAYDIRLADITLETKQAEIQERFRLESEKINKANFSAADKALALKDEEIKRDNALSFAQKQRNISVKGAKLELEQPFVEALRNENLEINKQNALLGRLKEGYRGLTPEQEASFIIEEKIAALKADQQKLIQSNIDNLKEQIQLRLENLKILEKEEALRSARTELGVIGAGLKAGFTGSAAGIFERTMIKTEGDVSQATKLAEIETKAMQMRSVFEGIQGAIDGISGAFASMMTEGVTALVTGTATAKEVFASFLQSVAQALQQAAAQMIATYIAIGIAKIFAGLAGPASTSATGPNPGGIPSTGNITAPSVNGVDLGAAANLAAKGAYFNSGMSYFATGGIVSSPTFFQFADGGKINMGLMGEAGPEAIMPLKRGPDGRLGISMYDASRKTVANAENNAGISSIDYEDDGSIGGGSSSRQSVAARAAQAVMSTRLQVMEQRSLSEKRSEMRQIEEMIASPAKINVEYQSQVINNVEYVTRDQAERMASQSALRGRELAIGALQNSVKTRKRVGMG
jgi:tape measure domain-containing protein